nr:hypothetical protein BHI3_37340 [Bacteriovorax sp. HI3]
MNEAEVNKRIEDVFHSVLGSGLEAYTKGDRQIESVIYVELLIAFQNEFKIKFSTQEFFSLRSIENIRKGVVDKLQK